MRRERPQGPLGQLPHNRGDRFGPPQGEEFTKDGSSPMRKKLMNDMNRNEDQGREPQFVDGRDGPPPPLQMLSDFLGGPPRGPRGGRPEFPEDAPDRHPPEEPFDEPTHSADSQKPDLHEEGLLEADYAEVDHLKVRRVEAFLEECSAQRFRTQSIRCDCGQANGAYSRANRGIARRKTKEYLERIDRQTVFYGTLRKIFKGSRRTKPEALFDFLKR